MQMSFPVGTDALWTSCSARLLQQRQPFFLSFESIFELILRSPLHLLKLWKSVVVGSAPGTAAPPSVLRTLTRLFGTDG
jgi:hypothetical protein